MIIEVTKQLQDKMATMAMYMGFKMINCKGGIVFEKLGSQSIDGGVYWMGITQNLRWDGLIYPYLSYHNDWNWLLLVILKLAPKMSPQNYANINISIWSNDILKAFEYAYKAILEEGHPPTIITGYET